MTTMNQTIYPLVLICLVFGFGIYSREKMWLSVFYNITSWICYSYLWYYTVFAFKVESYYLDLFTLSTTICAAFTVFVSVIISIIYDKRFRVFLKRLEAVDYTLSKLDTSQTYKQLHRYVIGIITAWCICCLAGNMCDLHWWGYLLKTRWCIIIPFVTNHMYHVNMMVNVLFSTLLWYIGTRFDKISERMNCLLIQEEYKERCTWRRLVTHRNMENTNNYKHIFWTLMHLHLELCQIARELNMLFETQLTLEMMGCLIFTSRMIIFYITYLVAIVTKTYVFPPTFIWINLQFFILLFMTKMFYLNFVCETVSAKAKKIEKIIQQMTYFFRYADIHNEIHQFILQITHNPLKFSGLGLFDFGYTFLQKFLTRTVTCVIFVMQNMTFREKEFLVKINQYI